jgi:CubicO group peptidase (beta-lactamase class C family)
VTYSDARRLIVQAVENGVTPAATIEVGRAAAPVWRDAFGRLTYDGDAPAITAETVFDLASLTKVIATTSLVMRAVAAGRLAVEQPVGEVLEEWRDTAHVGIRVRHLLDHSSGLPGHVRLWEVAHGRREYESAIHNLPLASAPGAQSVYSDVGFMVLGFLLERLAAEPLDVQYDTLQQESWGGAMTFTPSSEPDRIAPTEFESDAGRLVRGTVHDENARALGGVAGHAGLFGSVVDVGRFARMVLRTVREPTPLGTPELMRAFARETGVPGSSRALGWDVMRPTSSCGRLFSPTAIGHTGFTGTSLWIDWERDLYVAFLTNRIHPTRTNDSLVRLRPELHDAIVKAREGDLPSRH